MVRIGILNSDSIRYEDVDMSVYAKAFLTPWVIDGLSISEVDGQIVVAKGNGLIACTRSNGDEVVVPIVVKKPETIEKLNGKLVCISIPQANIDNPTINTDRNKIAQIVLSDTVGANSIKIGRIDSTGALLQEQDKSWLSDGAMLRDILLRGAVMFSQPPSSLQEPTEDSHLTTKQYVDDTIANAWAVSKLTETLYPLWEPVTKNDCLFVEDAGRIEDITTFQEIGKTTANQKVAYRIMGNGVSSNSISLPLCAVGNSPIPLTVRIEGGENQPNGQLVHTQAQATISKTQMAYHPIVIEAGYDRDESTSNRYNAITFTAKRDFVCVGLIKSTRCNATGAELKIGGATKTTGTVTGNTIIRSQAQVITAGQQVELWATGGTRKAAK